MEALMFTFNSIVMVILILQGLRDDRRAPGTPETGIFRSRNFAKADEPPAPTSIEADHRQEFDF